MIPRQLVITAAMLCALTIAMAIYLRQLQRREAATSQPVTKLEPATPPTTGATESVTIYVAYDNPGELRAQSVSIPLASGRQQRAEALLRDLVHLYAGENSPHPLGAGADIRDVFLVDPGLAVIDLNSIFADSQVSGVLSEELTVASIVQSLSANIPGLVRAKFLVDGKERETLSGHADLSEFYDVAQVSELAKQLSAQ